MKIYRYSTELEAQEIKALLEAQNIPCELHSFENWGYASVFRGQIGMGEVIVPDDFSNKAKEIINKFIKEERNRQHQDDEFKILKLQEKAGAYKYIKILCDTIFYSLYSPWCIIKC